MTAPKHTADEKKVVELLEKWISDRADPKGREWIEAKRAEIGGSAPDWKFFTSFSGVPRFLGKSDLDLSNADRRAADEARAGWDPSDWSVDQAGRTLLVLSIDAADSDAFLATLDKVFSTADVGESIALYQSLPVLPFPERFATRAAEGIRSNISSVFNAVALDSPYPSEYLNDAAWNQMVLKAIFVGSPLHRIKGIDERANPELARMLVDFARERRAASRSVTPDLWRPVGPFLTDEFVTDVALALDSGLQAEREAAALALHDSRSEPAHEILDKHPELKHRIDEMKLTWETLASERRE